MINKTAILLIMCVPLFAEDWGKEQLEDFVSHHIMADYHKTQITAWGTWNFYDMEIDINAIRDKEGNVNYSIKLPFDLVDNYIYIGACSDWADTKEGHEKSITVRFEDELNKDKTEEIKFTFPQSTQNKSFVTIEGWKNGKQKHYRIWLCGFTGMTSIGKLEKFKEPWPRVAKK